MKLVTFILVHSALFPLLFFPLSLLSVLVLEKLRGAKHRKQLGRRRDTIPHSASHRRCDLNWCEIYAKAPNCSRKTDHGEGVRNEWPEWRWGRRTAETEGTWTCHRTEMDGEREREKQIEREEEWEVSQWELMIQKDPKMWTFTNQTMNEMVCSKRS